MLHDTAVCAFNTLNHPPTHPPTFLDLSILDCPPCKLPLGLGMLGVYGIVQLLPRSMSPVGVGPAALTPWHRHRSHDVLGPSPPRGAALFQVLLVSRSVPFCFFINSKGARGKNVLPGKISPKQHTASSVVLLSRIGGENAKVRRQGSLIPRIAWEAVPRATGEHVTTSCSIRTHRKWLFCVVLCDCKLEARLGFVRRLASLVDF